MTFFLTTSFLFKSPRIKLINIRHHLQIHCKKSCSNDWTQNCSISHWNHTPPDFALKLQAVQSLVKVTSHPISHKGCKPSGFLFIKTCFHASSFHLFIYMAFFNYLFMGMCFIIRVKSKKNFNFLKQFFFLAPI